MNYKQEYENLNNYKNNQLSYANKQVYRTIHWKFTPCVINDPYGFS